MPFDTQDFNTDIPYGQTLRLPCKFITTGTTTAPQAEIQYLAQILKKSGKNFIPVIVKETGDDNYQAVANTNILEAAKLAGLDFVWCVVVNDEMMTQVEAEMGQVAEQPKAQEAATVAAPEAKPEVKKTTQKVAAKKAHTVKELKALCKQLGIKGYTKLSKAQMMDLVAQKTA